MKKFFATAGYVGALLVAGVLGAMYGGGHLSGAVPAVGRSTGEPPQRQAAAVDAVAGSEAAPVLAFEDVEQLLRALPADERAALVADAQRFRRFVEAEARLQSVLRAARANDMDRNPTVALAMRRQADRVLAEAYLRELARVNLGEDFPSEEQVRKFYEDNRAQFVLPRRVHLWQVFWPLPEDAPAAEADRVLRQAREVRDAVRAGKLQFADAAARHSAHAASRLHGGYMGLVAVDELLPEVREAVLALEEGALSEPIRTASGLHLVRRGAMVPARELGFDEAAGRARQLLVSETTARLRESVAAKARERYPVAIDEAALERWRQRLQPAG